MLRRAAGLLRAGGLVAFPTETVYGIGAHALDEAAVRRIFAAKGRPSFNPLITHVANAAAARALVSAWPELADRFAAEFWPGPLTLVLPKADVVPGIVTAGLDTVAVRVPAHPVALGLLREAGLPLAAPSANRYTEVSPTTAGHVRKSLGDLVDLILDGGPTRVGIESTVLDLSGQVPRLLRPGGVPLTRLEEVAGPISTAVEARDPTAPRPAPGMIGRHYAPRASLLLFDAADPTVALEQSRRASGEGVAVGAVLLTPLDVPIDHPVRMPPDPAGYASRLYAALHELDDLGCGLVLVERVPAGSAWAGIRDRLDRASTA